MLIVLEDESAPSWNYFYSGRSNKARSRQARRAHWLVFAEVLLQYPDVQPFDNKVHIEVTAYYENRRQWIDPDNVLAKIYIDGLIPRVLHNDNPDYVDSVTTRSRLADKPRVEIEIKEIDDGPGE